MVLPYSIDNSKPIFYSDEENRQINAFSLQINIHDSKFILNYAASLQKKIADLPDLLLKQLKSDYSSEANEMIVNLLSELMNFNSDNSVFEDPIKNRKALIKLRGEYTEISGKLSSLIAILQEQQLIFMQNSSMLRDLHKKSFIYFKKICMFIEAGKRKLRAVTDDISKINENASLTIDEAFTKNSLLSAYSRFDMRINELETAKSLAFMFNSQIGLYLNNNSDSLKKIKEIAKITIPAWEKRVKLALRLGDIVELVTTTSANPRDFIDTNMTLSESISNLGKTLNTNTENKKVFDELYLLGQEIQKSLETKK